MPRLLTIFALLAACSEPLPPPPPPVPSADLAVPPQASWPAEAAPLVILEPPPAIRSLRVALDPGHGAGSNSGNHSSLCIDEQDHNLRVARHLAASLEAAGHIPLLTRSDNAGPAYSRRIARAGEQGADLLISLHSDARGAGHDWQPEPGLICSWNDADPGFSVLWSDEGSDDLVDARLDLARTVARRLEQAGFPPYDGHQYSGIYEGDPGGPGVFVDRHQPRWRIRMLRRPAMPSIIIETHNAWDRSEEMRWQRDDTLEAFDSAILAALADLSAEPIAVP